MNAIEFVKEFGWDEAKRLLSTQGKTIAELRCEFTEKQLKIFQGYIVKDGLMSMVKLKTLVDAWELVQSYGGLKSSIETHNCFKNACDGVGIKHSPKMVILKQAIELVEKCNAEIY